MKGYYTQAGYWGFYNGSYMLGNAAIAAVVLFLLCAAVDPKTLKPMGRK